MLQLNAQEVQKLYSAKLRAYRAFISFFRSRQAIRVLLENSGLLRPGLRVLDAGCGFGTATFALLDALRRRNIEPQVIEAFDLTSAMLVQFQGELESRGISHVRLKQANVLKLEELPASWTAYDLIVSTSMLEYVSGEDLSRALAALYARLGRRGILLVVITRRSWITKILIEWCWHAARYTRKELREAFVSAGFRDLAFIGFPFRYFWQNFSNYVIVAKRGE
jgi:ubiquinone/menaquinone biosynthesis C-methylase UbiE